MTNLYSNSCINQYPNNGIDYCIFFVLGMLAMSLFWLIEALYRAEKCLSINKTENEKGSCIEPKTNMLIDDKRQYINSQTNFCVKLNIIKNKNISTENYQKHMTYIAVQLKKKFNCATVHVLPYEITMIFLAVSDKHIFNGINTYILSNITSYATSLLTSCVITDTVMNETNEVQRKNILNTPCCFKADLNTQNLSNFILERSRYYGYRNFVSDLALKKFTTQQLERIDTSKRIKMLIDQGVDIKSYPDECKYGSFIKTFKRDNRKNKIYIVSINPSNKYIFNKIIYQSYGDEEMIEYTREV